MLQCHVSILSQNGQSLALERALFRGHCRVGQGKGYFVGCNPQIRC